MSDSESDTISQQESIPISYQSCSDDSTPSYNSPLSLSRRSSFLEFNPTPASQALDVKLRVKGGGLHDEGVTYTVLSTSSLHSIWRTYSAACNRNHWNVYLRTSRRSLERNSSLANNNLITGDIILAYDRGGRGVPADLLSPAMDFCLICVRTSTSLHGLNLGKHFRCRKSKRVGRVLTEWATSSGVDAGQFTYVVENTPIDFNGTLEAQQILDGDVIVATPIDA